MDTSMFLAKLLGLYLFIVALGVLFNLETYRKVINDSVRNIVYVYFGGILALLFGLLIVLVHNSWVANWTVIVTVIGWLALIKGIWLLVFPGTLIKFAEYYQGKTAFIVVQLLIVLGIGFFLMCVGFCSYCRGLV